MSDGLLRLFIGIREWLLGVNWKRQLLCILGNAVVVIVLLAIWFAIRRAYGLPPDGTWTPVIGVATFVMFGNTVIVSLKEEDFKYALINVFVMALLLIAAAVSLPVDKASIMLDEVIAVKRTACADMGYSLVVIEGEYRCVDFKDGK